MPGNVPPARSSRPSLLSAFALSAVLAVGCGGGEPDPAADDAAEPAAAEGSDAPTSYAEEAMAFLDQATPEERREVLLNPDHPEWSRAAPPVWHARFETSKGAFVVEAVREHAPHGVDRFYNLIRLGYYDDVRFHRVNEGYIVQWGLHGDPEVNEVWVDETIPDDPKYGSNERGTFAYAQAPEPENRTTQIYINVGDNTRNDGEPFAIFGRVVEGMDVVDQLYSGYGEDSGSGVRQGRQGAIIEGGNEYLDREFPRLDRLERARIIDYEGG